MGFRLQSVSLHDGTPFIVAHIAYTRARIDPDVTLEEVVGNPSIFL